MTWRGEYICFTRHSYQGMTLKKDARKNSFEVIWRELKEIIESTGGLVYDDDKIKIIVYITFAPNDRDREDYEDYMCVKALNGSITKIKKYPYAEGLGNVYHFCRKHIMRGA